MESAKTIVAIGGPTGSGKSSAALALARALSGKAEILCADSITHYRGFDIGSAKPSAAERAEIPHHLLDICDPNEDFTAAAFLRAADAAIQGTLARGNLPIIVGGSGFYVKALLRGMAAGEEDPEERQRIRTELEARIAHEGNAALHAEMLALDPALASRIHVNDNYRIVRALEAMRLSGKPWSELNLEAENREARYPGALLFCFGTERPALEPRIERRTRAMLASGLVAEVEGLLARGVSPDAKPMRSVGYRQVLEFLGKFDPENAEERPRDLASLALAIERATHRLAKNQRTWHRSQKPEPIFLKSENDPVAAAGEILACLPGL